MMKKLIFSILLSVGSILFIQGQVTDNPEPAGWYSGDIHVHRNCGNGTGVTDIDKFPSMMEPNNLAVISVLADMGNGEVKYSAEDLLNVTGGDAPGSKPGHIIHWDAEWHW